LGFSGTNFLGWGGCGIRSHNRSNMYSNHSVLQVPLFHDKTTAHTRTNAAIRGVSTHRTPHALCGTYIILNSSHLVRLAHEPNASRYQNHNVPIGPCAPHSRSYIRCRKCVSHKSYSDDHASRQTTYLCIEYRI